MDPICADLIAEHDDLDAVLSALDESTWDAPTPAEGWSVRDQVSHLCFFDQRALLAITDPAAFAEDTRRLLAADGDPSVRLGRTMAPDALLDEWRRARSALVDAARRLDSSARVPWYGPAMGARSFVTARLMETWAHGQDVVDAVGVVRSPTERLRHVAHIGVRARAYSYAVNRRTLPDADVFVSLESPTGGVWQWGAPSSDAVVGPALDFCLVVTQRRHPAGTALEIRGDAAADWIAIAQAFAGPPGSGRPLGSPGSTAPHR